MCDAIYTGNTQQTLKKRMDGHFSDVQKLRKPGQKLDSFVAHYKQRFNSTISHINLHMRMVSEVVKQLNPVGSMKIFMELNCNVCMEERLTTPQKLRDKYGTLLNKNWKYMGPDGIKRLSINFA